LKRRKRDGKHTQSDWQLGNRMWYLQTNGMWIVWNNTTQD